jgi:threonine synthase
MEKNLFEGLECLSCHSFFEDPELQSCPECGGILTGKYMLDNFRIDLNKRGLSIWQFKSLFPKVSEENITSMGEGWTPYINAKKYGDTIGLKHLMCKIEGSNPSGSFKDRAASLEISLAKEWNKVGIFTASSGNAAAAIAAYSSRAGLKSLILVREDSTISKLGQISMYGTNLIRVRDLFETKQTLLHNLSRVQEFLPKWRNGFIWAPFNPLLTDALKTISFEIASGRIPEYVFVPTAGGDLLYGIYKGFEELRTMGLIDKPPRMVVVQGEGANPTVEAVRKNLDKVEDTYSSNTIAGALRVNFGASHALSAVKKTGGFGVTVNDREILEAQYKLARLEGIFAEISSVSTLAAIDKSVNAGKISKHQTVCAILTGNGFKDYYPSFKEISEVPLYKSVEEMEESLYGL